MAILKSLLIELGMVKAGSFDKTLNDAHGKLKGLGGGKMGMQGIEQAIGGLKHFAVAAAAVVGVGLGVHAAIEAIGASLDRMHEIEEVSNAFDISTETVSAWGYAAKRTGNDMESITTMLAKMEENIGKAMEGDSVGEKFKKLGIDIKAFGGDTEGVVRATLKGIAEIPNAAARMHVAKELLGKGAGKMMPFILDLSDNEARAKKMGLVYSQLQVAQAAEARASLVDVREMFLGWVNIIAIQLAPLIQAICEGIADFGGNTQSIAPTVLGVIEDIVKFFARLADIVAMNCKLIQLLLMPIMGIGAIIAGLLGGKEAYNEVADSIREMGKSIGESLPSTKVDQFFDNVRKRQAELKKELDEKAGKRASDSSAFAAAQAQAQAFTKVSQEVDKLNKKLQEEINTLQYGKEQADLMGMSQQGATSDMIDAVRKKMEDVKNLTAMKSGEDLIKSIKDQKNNLVYEATGGKQGMNNEQRALFDLGNIKGAGDLVDKIKLALKDKKKWQLFADDFKAAQEVKKSLESPAQKFAQEAEGLGSMFNRELLNKGEFTQALKNAWDRAQGQPFNPNMGAFKTWDKNLMDIKAAGVDTSAKSPEQILMKEQLEELKKSNKNLREILAAGGLG